MNEARIAQLQETRDKISAEIRLLRNEANEPSVIQGATAPMNSAQQYGLAQREKTPEEIIAHLFTYHPPQDEVTLMKYESVRDAAKALALQIWKAAPYGRDRTRAIDTLRDAVAIANAAIANNGVSLQ